MSRIIAGSSGLGGALTGPTGLPGAELGGGVGTGVPSDRGSPVAGLAFLPRLREGCGLGVVMLSAAHELSCFEITHLTTLLTQVIGGQRHRRNCVQVCKHRDARFVRRTATPPRYSQCRQSAPVSSMFHRPKQRTPAWASGPLDRRMFPSQRAINYAGLAVTCPRIPKLARCFSIKVISLSTGGKRASRDQAIHVHDIPEQTSRHSPWLPNPAVLRLERL